jgi:hypothetical protein
MKENISLYLKTNLILCVNTQKKLEISFLQDRIIFRESAVDIYMKCNLKLICYALWIYS